MWKVSGGSSSPLVPAEAIGFPLAVAGTAGRERSTSARQALPAGRFWQAEPSSGELWGRTGARSGSAGRTGNPTGKGSGEEPALQESGLEEQRWVPFCLI